MSLTRLDDKRLPPAFRKDWQYVDILKAFILYLIRIDEKGLFVHEYSFKRFFPIAKPVMQLVLNVLVHLIEMQLGTLIKVFNVVLTAKFPLLHE